MNFGFEPVYTLDCKVLILGSFPSVKSREINFYYGNKQNRFWKMLSAIFNIEIGDSVEEKIKVLNSLNIAIWDIVDKSNIKGSSDLELLKNITKKDINDINGLIKNTKITKILCNGKASYNLTTKFVKTNVEIICMPSTSPANVSYNIKDWEKELKNI